MVEGGDTVAAPPETSRNATIVRIKGGAVRILLLLAYPFVHFPVPALSAATAAEMTVLPPLMRSTPEGIAQMVQAYVGRIHSLPADALPGAAPVEAALPPTRVIVAEYDDLRPSGELLAQQ